MYLWYLFSNQKNPFLIRTPKMASFSPQLSYTRHHHHLRCSNLSGSSSINRFSSSPINLHRPFLGLPSNPSRSIRRCRARIPDPPPEQPDPPPDNPPVRFTGVTTTLSRVRDTAQIFLAVLFWMSLFFWASAWDGKNTGRRNKRNNFRR